MEGKGSGPVFAAIPESSLRRRWIGARMGPKEHEMKCKVDVLPPAKPSVRITMDLGDGDARDLIVSLGWRWNVPPLDSIAWELYKALSDATMEQA